MRRHPPGLILGFGGVLIGLAPDNPTFFQLLGQVVAAVAAAVAGSALWPRVASAVGPRALRDRYLSTDATTTKLRLLDKRIWLFEQDEKRLEDKVARLKAAVWVLGGAVLMMLVGGIVDYVEIEEVHHDGSADPGANRPASAAAAA